MPTALTPYIMTDLISSLIDVQMIAAIDIDEDGRVDIMAQRKHQDGSSHLEILYNNFYVDSSFYIKAMMLYEQKKPQSTRTLS